MTVTRIQAAEARLQWIQSFMRSYYSFFALANSRDELDDKFLPYRPFRHLSDTLLYDIVNSWCKLFGSKSEESHWKNLLSDHDHFRAHLLHALSYTPQEYSAYHLELTEFRNKYVSHFEPARSITRVPKFDKAHDSMVALNDYLIELPEFLGNIKPPKPIARYGEKSGRLLALGLNIPYRAPPRYSNV
jgi:hypothetical protein